MRDEFSDELDGENNAGNDSYNDQRTGTGNASGTDASGWRDNSAVAGSRIEIDGTGTTVPSGGTSRGGRGRKSDAKPNGIGSSNSGIGNAAESRNGSASGIADGSATGTDRTGNGGRSGDDAERTETGTKKRARADDLWIESEDEPAPPKRVKYGELGKEKRKVSDKFDSEILKLGVEFCFTAPTFLLPPGTADHWPLSEPEADELAKRLQILLAALPGKKKTRLMKLMEVYGPWVLFAVSASLITYPRVAMTRKLLAQSRNTNAPETQTAESESRFRRYPNFGNAQAGNATRGGANGSTNGVDGIRRSGSSPFDVNNESY